MDKEHRARLEVLRLEIETVQLLRRRAKEDPLRAIAAAQRELELREEIQKLTGEEVAA